MPNPVVRFVIRGADKAALERFYRDVFGWQFYEVAGDFSVIEMTSHHDHDPQTGAHINQPISLDVTDGLLAWRFEGEFGPAHMFTDSLPEGGGLASGSPNVTVYVEVEDVASTLAQAVERGGSVVQEPFEIPGYTTVGRFADPEGNVIGIQARRLS